jgi:iron(III) transport system ATP-binding protein
MPRDDAMQAGLTISSVSHAYARREVVHHVSVDVAPGELICLVGPSGCGKTTLLRLAAGLETLQQGRIAVAGRIVAEPGRSLPPESRGIGMVFQDYALFPHLTVAGNVGFGLDKLATAEGNARVAEVLVQVGMADAVNAYPHQLSGGQQQRVALARALAPRPQVMLLDEPFSGLDTRLRERIRDDTLHVLKQSGAATLMVTHDPEEAMFMADRIAIMRDGQIEQQGRPADVYAAPATAFVASFFGQLNEWSGQVAAGVAATPFGPVPAPGLAEASEVDVLIRPEALRLGAARASGCTAKVLAARLLGRSSWIHLCLGPHKDGPGHEGGPGHLHFHARMPGRFLPAEGEIVAVILDPSQAFVFPKRPPT